jgi:hypothetical protein
MKDLKNWTMFSKDTSTSSLEIALSSTTSVPNTFTFFSFMLNQNMILKFKRGYPKLQSVVANIGGIMKFIMMVSSLLSQYVSSQLFYVDLANYFIRDENGCK